MFIKVCCISSREEAETALAAGADALGLVSAMPSGPGIIDEADIRDIAAFVGNRALTVLLTQKTRTEAVARQHAYCGTGAIQLVDEFAEAYPTLRRALAPDTRLIQVAHVRTEDDVAYATDVSRHVDMVLLDSGRPEGRPGDGVRELGGTGRAHDWRLSGRIVARAACPVLLAGGLTPDNAREAALTACPAGLDVCSGVRSDGRLDAGKVNAFVLAARGCETRR